MAEKPTMTYKITFIRTLENALLLLRVFFLRCVVWLLGLAFWTGRAKIQIVHIPCKIVRARACVRHSWFINLHISFSFNAIINLTYYIDHTATSNIPRENLAILRTTSPSLYTFYKPKGRVGSWSLYTLWSRSALISNRTRNAYLLKLTLPLFTRDRI